MARRKQRTRAAPAPASADAEPTPSPDSRIFAGGPSLHELFQQQVRQTLAQSDLDEQAKQAVLVALTCPCCGTGGMNYTAKIKRRS